MADPSDFVYIVDRYLEVSNVYHLRMGESVLTKDDALQHKTRRLQKLASKIEEGLKATRRNNSPVKVVPDGQEQGQIVTTTAEFLKNTKRRQRDVLARMTKLPDWVPQPTNIKRATTLLELDAAEFLGCFPSPSYASDVLSELASWTVCPDVALLAARDMVHMHAVELQRHLMRLITQVKLLAPDQAAGSVPLTVKQLRELESAGSLQQRKDLVESIVENAVPRDPRRLFKEFEPLATEPPALAQWLRKRQDSMLEILINANVLFSDALHVETFDDARKLCDDLVVYGLVSTYSVWYSSALDKPGEIASFRTSILFCTRILLDEERWEVCRQFAQFALEATKELNQREGISDKDRGMGMLTANSLFARVKAGERNESIAEDIARWEVASMHPRYKFLKLVLLRKFNDAATIALELLHPSPDTGVPNMCLQEFAEWPILEDFRKSDPGKKILSLRTGNDLARNG